MTQWPTVLTITEQLIQLPLKDNEKIVVTVENLSDNITLCSHTTLGWLHSVDAIYPLQTKPMEDQEPQTDGNAAT